ncbi:hypothetical protein SAMN05444156_2449 [Verrucomicrobium sp. GAS474]|nr:hypothetical protein SAMN05444156_2449 [Verrucomicrobium sp. GAS474]
MNPLHIAIFWVSVLFIGRFILLRLWRFWTSVGDK